jgi:hypothetical protein
MIGASFTTPTGSELQERPSRIDALVDVSPSCVPSFFDALEAQPSGPQSRAHATQTSAGARDLGLRRERMHAAEQYAYRALRV